MEHNVSGYYIDEYFKPVQGFENYVISNYGRVRNINTDKILKARLTNGYQLVSLFKKGQTVQKYIHRLVADAFIPNEYAKPYVNHIDEDRANNHVSNLAWVTAKENSNWGTRNKRISQRNAKPIFVTDIDGHEVGIFYSIKEACEVLGVNKGNASKVARGKLSHANNLIFYFVDVLEQN